MAEAVVPEVIELLDSYGEQLRWIHVPDSRTVSGTKGFPDFVIAGPKGILWREVKPHRGAHLSPHQTAWRYVLAAAGADFRVWCADDISSGQAEKEVEAIL